MTFRLVYEKPRLTEPGFSFLLKFLEPRHG